MRPKYEVAEIIQEYGEDFYRKHKVSFQAKRTLYALSVCRTAALSEGMLKDAIVKNVGTSA